jgi:hypothetical protein
MGALDNFAGRLIDVHTTAAPLVRKQATLSIISRRFTDYQSTSQA